MNAKQNYTTGLIDNTRRKELPRRTTYVDDKNTIQVVTFKVGGEEYVVDIMRIKEIIEPRKITPVPKAPDFIEGVIDLRGTIIPIIDLRKRFGIDPLEDDRMKKFVVLVAAGRLLGIIVDMIQEIIGLPKTALKPAPPVITRDTQKYIIGVARHEGRLLLLLNIKRILTHREQVQLDYFKDLSPLSDENPAPKEKVKKKDTEKKKVALPIPDDHEIFNL